MNIGHSDSTSDTPTSKNTETEPQDFAKTRNSDIVGHSDTQIGHSDINSTRRQNKQTLQKPEPPTISDLPIWKSDTPILREKLGFRKGVEHSCLSKSK